VLKKKKQIDEWALDYWLLQQYSRLCFRIYYRRIEIINRQNLPKNVPVILAPNHQNALMDAMVLVCNTKYQAVFLARADIFKGKRLIRFLTYLNIMPIYRLRDGIEKVKKNDEVFEKTIQVLHNKYNPLCLFPEGNHGDKRRLRPLVKGLFRIAFQAQEEYGEKPYVKIIPIGYDYGHYQHFRSTLFVNFGKPIEVAAFFPLYKTNPVQAINMLKEEFAAKLSKLMIDIQTVEFYETYMFLRKIYNDDMRASLNIKEDTLSAKFRADKAMIDLLNLHLESHPDEIRELKTMVMHYQDKLKNAGLRDWVLKKDTYSFTGFMLAAITRILLFPVFIVGWVSNYLPFWFTGSRVKNIKDPQFHSSFKYVIGMIAFPVWYLVIAGVLFFIPLSVWIKLIYFLLLPVTGLFAFTYYINVKKFWAKFIYTCNNREPEIGSLKELRKRIISRMSDILNQQYPSYENSR
jgi:1-acyl-sn-glycerol-3-phosphate acyltransferase